jgi:hypothetical protein
MIQTIYETRRNNTAARHTIIKNRVNEIYGQTVSGMRLNFDDVIIKVASDMALSPRTIKNILKK